MYGNGEVVPRGMSHAAGRQHAADLEVLRHQKELAEAELSDVGHLTQRAITEALAINLVKAEASRLDPDDAMQFQHLAAVGVMRLARVLSGER